MKNKEIEKFLNTFWYYFDEREDAIAYVEEYINELEEQIEGLEYILKELYK